MQVCPAGGQRGFDLTVSGRRLAAPDIPGETLMDYAAALFRASSLEPEKTAIIDGARVWTWSQFTDLAARTASALVDAGLRQGDRVSCLSENSAHFMVLYSAVIIAGGCIVPLPTGAQPDALARMHRGSGATHLFASPALMKTARTLGADHLHDLSTLEAFAQSAVPHEPAPASPDALFDIIYSSGTTGTPKGIVHDHRFRARQLDRMPQFGLKADAVLMVATPMYSNTTLVAVLPVLAHGGTLVVMSKFDTEGFLDRSQTHRATHAMLVPVQYMRLMDDPRFDTYDLSAYRAKLSTSAPLPRPLIERVLKRWPGELYEFYGMTEGGVTTVLDCRNHPDKLDSVGRPAEGCDLRIIGPDRAELAIGEVGEIVGRSGSMMPAYFNEPTKTEDLRWQNAAGEDFIRTGDIGRVDAEGFLTLLDRQKDVINSGGQNVFAADLEQILRTHPAVADVAVIAVPCPTWGETPLALVVRAEPVTKTTSEAALLNWANERLGKMQRLSAISFTTDLPRSDIGKILKRELRARYWDKAQ